MGKTTLGRTMKFIRNVSALFAFVGIPTLVVYVFMLKDTQIEVLESRIDMLKDTQVESALTKLKSQREFFESEIDTLRGKLEVSYDIQDSLLNYLEKDLILMDSNRVLITRKMISKILHDLSLGRYCDTLVRSLIKQNELSDRVIELADSTISRLQTVIGYQEAMLIIQQKRINNLLEAKEVIK